MKSLLAISLASMYGLCIRLLFASADGLIEIMSITFIFLLPMIIGYLTVALMPRHKVQSTSAAFWMPWLTSLVLLVITIAFSVEGAICWIMIFPIFAIFAGIGGWIAFARRKGDGLLPNNSNSGKNDDILDAPNKFQVSLIILLPLVFGFLEGKRTQKKLDFNITQEITIAAPPSKVWKTILNIGEIKQQETNHSFATVLGFPNHLETTLDTLAIGGKRLAKYEKGLVFEEIITKYEPEKLLVLDINTDPNKIPPTVMDEHIVIGGKHLDILEDIYTLDALPDGSTRVRLSSRFYINHLLIGIQACGQII